MWLCIVYTATNVTIGLQQTMYTVMEDTATVFLCASVLVGNIAGRTISIDYQTLDNRAEGKYLIILCIIILCNFIP